MSAHLQGIALCLLPDVALRGAMAAHRATNKGEALSGLGEVGTGLFWDTLQVRQR
jgi:hypothetical protein